MKAFPPPRSASPVADAFSDFITAPDFPCVGAKAALASGCLKIVPARDLTSGWNDLDIHRELLEWAAAYRRDPSGLRSLAVIFDGPGDLDEREFEAALWDRVQSLSDKDAWKGLPHDPRVCADPDNPHFSLSFGGEAFFVVGLHPRASRPARRFSRPVLVFNLHDQFEQLRAEGRYERMRERILDRDAKLAGSINPMLARHGEASEAAQYSGRLVGEEWVCPFRDPRDTG
ncbi:guanitoxin biosynthesis heme-dependent pre-guanitoxin N-hydroxylase GntA [Sphingopyxis panaciterrae]|uniref:guanitoxin biosynthesis heme-dependent pre-guanitoxin N-hydroxylase GntA n=1 Tax=Sphingopyxis panaciterrae TaxID=363841 RepID=UPI001424251A|nr:guanitoxin biosynthesis heme-dependent pre-guanitoxin N-hydroxylase GntA [Sphingopyxis panaciterrae]